MRPVRAIWRSRSARLAAGAVLVLVLITTLVSGWFVVQRVRRILIGDLREIELLMAKVEIVSHSSQQDTFGHLHIFGELENRGDEMVSQVQVTARFFDEEDARLGERKGPTISQVIRPGERASFDLMFDDPDAVSTYELDISGLEEGEAPISAMTILDHESQIESAGILERITVEGQLRNDTDHAVRFPKAVLTLYDEEGTVIGASFAYARPNRLAPSEVGAFRIIFLSLHPIAAYDVTADGEDALEGVE